MTQFLEAKAKGDNSGNYRRNAKRVITHWIDWLDQRDIENFEQLDETVLAHYAEHLRRRIAANEAETTNGGIARSTAWTYYNTVSAFLGWASKWGCLQENYARAGLAQESMPERSASQQSQQQFWTPDQRTQILNYVNKRARDAINEKGLDADTEARDRALVAVLAFTGVRASEIFRSEHDNRTGRQGIRWRDIDHLTVTDDCYYISDYKTDTLRDRDLDTVAEHYFAQLYVYACALSQADSTRDCVLRLIFTNAETTAERAVSGEDQRVARTLCTSACPGVCR